jgi:hypothetical protein
LTKEPPDSACPVEGIVRSFKEIDMKVNLFLKDPDGVYESVRDAVQETLPDNLSEDEQEELLARRTEDTHEKLKKWVEWKEYVTVQIDTDTGEAIVLPVKR